MSEPRSFLDGHVILHAGDCKVLLATMPDNSVDSIVTDPPYHLQSIVKRFGGPNAAPAQHGSDGAFKRASVGFMSKTWDGGDIAFQSELWAEVLRVMKPGAHAFIFGGDRTYHRLVCAVEDGGLEVRRTFVYAYGSGFPKSHNIAIDYEKELCEQVERNGRVVWVYRDDKTPLGRGNYRHPSAIKWDGFGTDIKPAIELICLARKQISESSISANVLRWGTGAINVGACKVGPAIPATAGGLHRGGGSTVGSFTGKHIISTEPPSRWPANLLHDNSEEVLACFPESEPPCGSAKKQDSNPGTIAFTGAPRAGSNAAYVGDSGSTSRFFASFPQEDVQRIFYTSKADNLDRLGSSHPTVKPIDLIQYLARLITHKNGVCLDLFAGSGTTGEACFREGFRAILIEREAEYIKDIERRMSLVMEGPVTRAHAGMKARGRPVDNGPLFRRSEA